MQKNDLKREIKDLSTGLILQDINITPIIDQQLAGLQSETIVTVSCGERILLIMNQPGRFVWYLLIILPDKEGGQIRRRSSENEIG